MSKQVNAHISNKDADLFYKLYLGILEFTNKKYKINLSIDIYNRVFNNYQLIDVVHKFWDNKIEIVDEFVEKNPYKLTKKELQLAFNFKKGINDIFIIVKYERNYTVVMYDDKFYYIKGLFDNIDTLIPDKMLPYPSRMKIFSFTNCLIYDGLLEFCDIKLKDGLKKQIYEMLEKSPIYYELKD